MLKHTVITIPKKVWKKWVKETKGMNMVEFFKWAYIKYK